MILFAGRFKAKPSQAKSSHGESSYALSWFNQRVLSDRPVHMCIPNGSISRIWNKRAN